MKISYDPSLTEEKENDQTIFFTLIDGEESFEWHGDIPKGVDIQGHIEANIEKIRCGIYRKQYPEALPIGSLEEWQEWESGGCKISAVTDKEGNELEPEKVLEKRALIGTHPETPLEDRVKVLEDKVKLLEAALAAK